MKFSRNIHTYLLKKVSSKKYWGRLNASDINIKRRTLHFGFYGIGYTLLDPIPLMAVGLLVLIYKYKGTQSKLFLFNF